MTACRTHIGLRASQLDRRRTLGKQIPPASPEPARGIASAINGHAGSGFPTFRNLGTRALPRSTCCKKTASPSGHHGGDHRHPDPPAAPRPRPPRRPRPLPRGRADGTAAPGSGPPGRGAPGCSRLWAAVDGSAVRGGRDGAAESCPPGGGNTVADERPADGAAAVATWGYDLTALHRTVEPLLEGDPRRTLPVPLLMRALQRLGPAENLAVRRALGRGTFTDSAWRRRRPGTLRGRALIRLRGLGGSSLVGRLCVSRAGRRFRCRCTSSRWRWPMPGFRSSRALAWCACQGCLGLRRREGGPRRGRYGGARDRTGSR